MSIATEISRIKDAKDAIRASIIAKGVNVPAAAKLDTYSDRIDEIVQTASGNMEVVTSSPSGTINAADNKFYMLSADAGALVFNLPAMQQGGHGIYLLMTTSSLSSVSFTATGGVTINFPSGFQVEADKCYLMDFEFAQNAWQVSVEEWFVNGGGSDKFGDVLKGIMNKTITSMTAEDWPSGVTQIPDGIFKNCGSLTKFYIPDSVTYISGNNFNGTNIKAIYTNALEFDGSFANITPMIVVSIPSAQKLTQAFYNARNIKKLVLGSNITNIGAYTWHQLTAPITVDLSRCTGLTAPTSSAFAGANVYKFKMPSSITNLGNLFLSGCNDTLLEMNATTPPTLNNKFGSNFWLPIFVPSAAIESYKTASNWSAYADLYRPHGYAITGVKAEVWDKTNKTIVTVPLNGSGVLEEPEIRTGAGVTIANQSYVFIGPDVTELGFVCFSGSTARCIDFTNATSLTKITCAMGGSSTGSGLPNIVEVDLTPTPLTTIDSNSPYGGLYYAFGFATSLTTVKLPSTVTNLGTKSFYYCISLLDFYCYATTPPSFNDCFNSCAIMNTKDPDQASIYVPSASVDAYKSASGWSAYAAIIKPIPES